MSENQSATPNLVPSNPQEPSTYVDEREQWRAQRRAWHEERRAARSGNTGAWAVGAVLILVGVVVLLQNFGLTTLNNWWALFILIPAFASFGSAYTMYRNHGYRFTQAARGPFIGGIVLTMISVAFLFGLNFAVIWPLLLIIAGFGMLLNFILPG